MQCYFSDYLPCLVTYLEKQLINKKWMEYDGIDQGKFLVRTEVL